MQTLLLQDEKVGLEGGLLTPALGMSRSDRVSDICQ